MTAPSSPAGRTVLTGRALRQTATGLVRDISGVPVKDITVHVSDLAGDLTLSVDLPFVLDGTTSDSLAGRGADVRDRVVTGLRELAARTAGVVNVRFSSVRRPDLRRVT